MKQAPNFTLQDQNGDYHSLEDYKGRWVVLYFYPKDNTPTCTTEACQFRDARSAIAEFGNAAVIGISQDSVASHKKFDAKYDLGFTLLSDPEAETIKAYGAWQDKKLFGRKYLGIVRMTHIIDPSGAIAKTYPKVNAETHAAEIIADLRRLQAGA